MNTLENQIKGLNNKVKTLEDKIDRLIALSSPSSRPFSTAEFAKKIGRKRRWVSDRCRSGRIKSLTNTFPYQIPESELLRIKKEGI